MTVATQGGVVVTGIARHCSDVHAWSDNTESVRENTLSLRFRLYARILQ